MQKSPIRILHVVGGMNRGGVETWLMHVLRNIDRERFQMDFLVHTSSLCAYDQEIRSLGSKIIPCLNPSRPLAYAREFRRIMQKHGPYDVIHSHVHHYSGYVLRLAQRAAVPIRIAHSHSDTSRLQDKAKLFRRIYFALTGHWINRYSVSGLAASREAAVALFGRNWESDPRMRVLYCAVDFKPFQSGLRSPEPRSELQIPTDAFVIGHVGTFSEQKNHMFLLDIFSEVIKREPTAHLLLVGDGPLGTMIKNKVFELGLSDRVVFAGLRSDVHRLMMGAMDVFVLPSLHEGLPLVGMEAQAAGMPFIMSDTITSEVDMIPAIIRRLSLSQPASQWAEAVISARGLRGQICKRKALRIMEQSPFAIEASVASLERVYFL